MKYSKIDILINDKHIRDMFLYHNYLVANINVDLRVINSKCWNVTVDKKINDKIFFMHSNASVCITNYRFL